MECVMRNRCLILLSMLGLLACSGKGMQTTDGGDGSGQAGSDSSGQAGQSGHAGGGGGQAGGAAGAAGSAAGAAGSILPSGAAGAAGTGGAGGAAGTGGAGGAAGTGGAAGQAGGGRGGTTAGVAGSAAGGTTAGVAGSAAGGTTAGGTGGSGGAGGVAGQAGGAGRGATGGVGGTAAGGTMGAGGAAGSAGLTGTGGAAGQAGATGSPGLTLLAGGLGGPGNIDGIGATARFSSPRGIASDGAGNLYVADSGIRKIVLATGAVTTVTRATDQCYGAVALTSDGAGNLYVACGDYTIRRVVIATGAVTTIAGTPLQSGSDDGTGASARFIGPSGIVGDGAGNLYVSDTKRSDIQSGTLVRKIVISTGTVTTLANEPGGYDNSGSIAIDGANLYVAYNYAVLKVAVATGAVTTLAGVVGRPGMADGTGANASFGNLTGIAADGAGNLYLTEGAGGSIRKVVIATRAVTTLADATGKAVAFDQPKAIAAVGSGSLYVGDFDNVVRKVVVATGIVTTVAGAASQPGSADATGAAARFNKPDSVASDGAGSLYVTDADNSTIRKIALATGEVTTLAGAAGQPDIVDGTGANARFSRPRGIVSDGAGNLYVADGIIRKIVIATGEVSTLTTGPGRKPYEPGPASLALDGAGNLYFDEAGDTIWKVAIATGALTPVAGTTGAWGYMDGPGATALFNGPSGLACDGAGNLYVADSYNNSIRKIVLATRAVTTLAGGDSARFNIPTDIAFDGMGSLYVADTNTIRKVAVDSGTVSTIIGSPDRNGVSLGALPASLSGASGVAVLRAGVLAIVDATENAVLIGRL
jgi:hypothetical protein